VGREDEVLKVERRKISELKSDPANARKHSPRNLKAIRDSLDVFGQQKPIVVDSRGVVIAGNGTLEAARELGWDEIDVAVTDLDPAHAQAFGIADNRTAELAEWDTDVLGQLLEGMDSDLADILSIDDLELPDSIDGGEQVEGLTDPDEVPEPPEEPTTQTGDLWLLGEHRLLCGDSTSAEDVGRLMDGAKGDLCITDPPYNINYGTIKHPKFKQRHIQNDNMARSEWEDFCSEFTNNIKLYTTGCVYVFGPPGPDGRVMFSVLDNCMHYSTVIIWNKDVFTLGRGKYQNKYEPCWFGWVNDGKNFCDKRNLVNVWDFPRPKKSEDHPTMKPIDLIKKPIEDASLRGNKIYDPFLGSGTTLIAAEQLGRKCYGMEIDPKYCDVIVKRWEEFTGQTATREAASKTANRENERT
jgi:DNA modification methylase